MEKYLVYMEDEIEFPIYYFVASFESLIRIVIKKTRTPYHKKPENLVEINSSFSKFLKNLVNSRAIDFCIDYFVPRGVHYRVTRV